MTGRTAKTRLLLAAAILAFSSGAAAQTVTQRGFIEGIGSAFLQRASNDPTRFVGDLLAREEAFVKPAPRIQFAAGADLRANSHDQVDDRWRVDFTDRGARRPRLAVRRLAATITRGPVTVDVGKQFIRWGKADIVTPTDRFAPRDFLNVVDAEFLPVTGARAVVQAASEAFEAVWVSRLTPSRIPLLDQRWTVVPSGLAAIPLVNVVQEYPSRSEAGLRWAHTGNGFEYSLSLFDGLNHLPNVQPPLGAAGADIRLEYPSIRTYGTDSAVPTRWFTLKGEAAYFTSPSATTDQYVLYVLQIERQTGEWLIVAGYAGEAVTARRSALTLAPDRGLTRSIVGRASYTIDTVRSVALETAVRQNGDGMYVKGEYSQARGAHWRGTIATVVIAGHSEDFLGQYRRNSHAAATLRYSF